MDVRAARGRWWSSLRPRRTADHRFPLLYVTIRRRYRPLLSPITTARNNGKFIPLFLFSQFPCSSCSIQSAPWRLAIADSTATYGATDISSSPAAHSCPAPSHPSPKLPPPRVTSPQERLRGHRPALGGAGRRTGTASFFGRGPENRPARYNRPPLPRR